MKKELNLCSYLVDRMNKLMPMCKAKVTVTRMVSGENNIEERDIPTIELMNGKKIYITQYSTYGDKYRNSQYSLNYEKYYIAFSVNQLWFIFKPFISMVNIDYNKFNNNYVMSSEYNFDSIEAKNNYENLSIMNFMKVVSGMVVNDLVNVE